MAEREQKPTEISETIRGIHADIALLSPDELNTYLETVSGHVTLFKDTSGALKQPIVESRLDYFREDVDSININADITFDAGAAHPGTHASWQSLLSYEVRERMDAEKTLVYKLEHHEHDFYAVLNEEYAAFVQFDVETHCCAVTISLEKVSEVQFELHQDIEDEIDHLEPANPYETLKELSALWSIVIDTTVDCFNENDTDSDSEKPQIIIAPPLDGSLDTNIVTPKHRRDNYTPGVTIPEVEASTSDSQGFALIGGLTGAKERLEDIAATFRDPDGAAMYGISGRHFILHGPVGTGKTSLVKALAHEIGANIRLVNSTDLVDMWVGNSGKNTRQLFETMKRVDGPLVVFFDEIDALARKGTGGTSERVDIKKYLNTAIDDISKNHPNIIIAAATNVDIDDLEPSIVRSGRLEPISAPAPNEDERIDVWAAVLHRSWIEFNRHNDIVFDSHGREYMEVFTPYDDDLNPVELAKMTDGMTGADFEVMLERARRKRYREYRATGEMVKVCQADLIREIRLFGR